MLGGAATLLAARWSPGAGARMALGTLVGSVMLLLLTCCPLPSWWTCTGSETTPEVARTASPPQVGKALPLARSVSNHSPGSGVGLVSLFSLLRNLGRVPAGDPSTGGFLGSWPMLVLLVLGAGSLLSFLQILLGLLEIRRGRLRSVRVENAELLQVVD